MAAPIHWLNLYTRPADGYQFFKRYRAYQWRHKISAVGWFDTASCVLSVPRAEAEEFFDMLEFDARLFVDNPRKRVWQGFINRVTLTIGNITYTSSLDSMSNRASVTYSAPDVSAAPQNTTAVDNTTSQTVYGIKEGALDGYLIEGTNITKLNTLRQTVANAQSWPQKSVVFNTGRAAGNDALLQIELLGWYHTLNWAKYTTTSPTGANNPDVIIDNALGTYPNPTFFSVSGEYIEANGAFSQNARTRIGQTYWEWFQSLQEAGDGSSRWVMGITNPDQPPWYNRGFYYRQANTDIEYFIRAADGKVRNVYGQIVQPWNVLPDRGVRIADVLPAWSGVGDDPSTFYIDAVDYESESQSVQFASTDNITAEGVFNVKQYFKTTGKRFGVWTRRMWS